MSTSPVVTPAKQMRLLSKMWGRRSKGYVFCPFIPADKARTPQRKSSWNEGPAFAWPEDKERILEHLTTHAEDDLYFSPMLFSQKARRKEYALASNKLWADLDESDPHKIEERYKPTHAWETSPGRFAAVWTMNEPREGVTEAGGLNHRLSHYVGADPSGWDTTQLLRVPGSANNKPDKEEGVRGKEIWSDRELHSWDTFDALPEIKVVKGGDHEAITEEMLNGLDGKALSDKYRPKIKDNNARRDMRLRDSGGRDRSDVAWGIEKELAKVGCPLDEMIAIIRSSVWNKFEGRADELKRLTKQCGDAIAEALGEVASEVATPESTEDSEGIEVLDDDADLMPWLVSDKSDWREDNLDVVNINALLRSDPPPVTYLERDLIIEERITKISAKAGSGKSINTAVMGFHWARGLSALDLERVGDDVVPVKLESGRKVVLYLDGELGETWWHQYLTAMGATDHDMSYFILKCFPKWGSLAKDEGAKRFWHLVNHFNPDVIVMDTVSAFTRGEKENDPEPWSKFDERILLPLKERGITAILNDHAGYSEEARRGRGHSSKQTNLDVEWGLSADVDDRDHLSLTREKDRTGRVPEKLELRRFDNPLRIERLLIESTTRGGKGVKPRQLNMAAAGTSKRPGRKKVPHEDKQIAIYDWVRENPNNSTARIIKGAAVRDADARKILGDFVNTGIMSTDKEGQSILYEVIADWVPAIEELDEV